MTKSCEKFSMTKSQIPIKSQDPMSKIQYRPHPHLGFGTWSLELDWDLGFGHWDFQWSGAISSDR
jgi:hypothetical protein